MTDRERVRTDRICAMTGLSKRQVQAMAAQGRIPSAAQLGKVWTFRESAVRRWIESRERKWQGTSIAVERHSGAAYRLPGMNIAEAYEQAIGLKRSSVSRSGSTG